MLKMNFVFDKESKIVVYGAGPMAVLWGEKAVSIGFTIRLFIDRNADNIKTVNNIPVITFEQYINIANMDDIVIIMLQNVMWHKKIVDQLQKLGIIKVIFFPMQVKKKNLEPAFCLRRKYNECIKFEFEDFLEVPILYDDEIFNKDEGLIWEDKKYTIVWAPIELCYSVQRYGEDIWKGDVTEESIELIKRYNCDKSLVALRPYWELLSFLDGKMGDCSIYLRINGEEGHIGKRNNQELLKDRNKLFDFFKEEICKGNEFFEQSPACAGLGNWGKIVIYDGVHRSIFLIDNGYWWIPVRLSNSDYSYLFHTEAVQKLKDYIEANDIRELEYPLEAFGFYNYPVNHHYVRGIWKKLIREITSRNWKFNAVFDLSLTDGYFARMFYREGSQIIYCLLDDGNEISLLANDIFRIDNIRFVYDANYLYKIMNKCEIIILRMEQLISLFQHDTFVWEDCLKCIVVYNVLAEESALVFERFFGVNRRFNLINRYVTDGIMKEMYIVE